MLSRNWILLWSFEHVLLVTDLTPAEFVLDWQVTELLIGLQLDFVPLITTPSALQSNQFPTYLTILISSQHFISLSMKMLCQRVLKTEILIKVRANNIHCSTCIYQASNFVTKGYDIDQAWFPVSKSMLIVSNILHILNKFGNGLQYYVFSTPFPGIEVKLISTKFSRFFFLPFLQLRVTFLSSSPQECPQTTMIIQM